MLALMHICLAEFLVVGLLVTVSARQGDAACESVQSCETATAENGQVRSLLQLGQEPQSVEEKAHSRMRQRFHDLEQRPITFITLYDSNFDTSLAKSSLYVNRAALPHQWMLVNNSNNECISKMYALAQAEAVNDLRVFLHSDIFLPDDFYDNFMLKLQQIEEIDPNWGVLGTAGIEIYTRFTNVSIASSITDPHGTFDTGVDNMEMQSLDESLMVLRHDSPMFDPDLPGFDLYGTDIVLSARKLWMKSYLLNLALSHKTMNAAGDEEMQEGFIDKVHTTEYQERLQTTITYFQSKWCSSDYLPIAAPVFYIGCQFWRSYI